MSKVIRVAIAGFGRSGYGIHTNCLRERTDQFKIVAVADQLPERRKDAVDEFGCNVYEDYRDMLAKEKDFDLLVNATPSRLHVETTIAGLEHGFNVLSEKPSATTVADFDRIIAAMKKSGKIFYPFQNSRFYPHFVKAREIIASGVLGDIVSIRCNWSNFARRWDWQTLQSECAGGLYNTGPHPVDQAVVLFGEGYPQVFARMHCTHGDLGGDAENHATVMLYGPGKPDIEVVVSSVQAYSQGEQINICGSRGGLTGGIDGLKWKYFKPEEAPHHELWKPWSQDRQYCSENLSWYEESWSFKNGKYVPFVAIVHSLYSNLYDVLVNGAEPAIKHEEVRKQIYVMEEAHKQNPLPRKS